MNDLYKAIDALNEISQAEMTARRKAEMDAAIKKAQNMQGSGKAVSDALRAAARAEKAYVKAASGAGAPTQDDVYRDIAADAIKQDAADKAAGIASYDEYLAGYQKNLDAIKAAGVNLDDVYATANKMLSTEKGAARLSSMGINDDDDLISYVMAKAGIADQTPDKYAYAPGGYMHPEIEKYYNKAKAEVKEDLTFETEESLDERVTYSTLAKLSGIADPNKIYPGQKITLPGGGSYTVKSGDTLSGIAQNYRLKKIGQPKKDKLDDPTTKIPQVPNKLGPDGQYDGDDLGNAPTTPDDGPGDFEVPSQYAGDDTDDMLNKYAFLRSPEGGDYKLDPKSVKQPPAKAPSKSLFKQIGDFVKGTKMYDIATSNPEPKIPATVQGKAVDLANPKTAPGYKGDYGDTSKMSVMDLAKKIEADPTWMAKSDAEKKADNASLGAYTDAQRSEIFNRLRNK